ncbi:hypothetical protein TWF694_000798 [Orbilia ellipsospora]|uniref:DNA recombination and repair protein Rad51-like C-terminal domain-containing protein n=1 Tax=Orbilia ellipsospora TaxID=2528407 RepID=A0AAV9XT27_9PEZI
MESGGGGVNETSGEGVKVGSGGRLSRQLLMEVEKHSETLSELLADVRLTVQHHNTRSHGPFHVPSIDNLLRPHLQDHLYNQSLGQSDPSAITGSYDIPSENADALPKDKPVIIEISSDRPCVGKTQLLYHLACVTLLPESWNGINLDGKDGAVVFIDCDGRFDILRLMEMICHYLQSRLSLAIQYCESQLNSRDTEMQNPQVEDQDNDDIEEYLQLLTSIDSTHIVELTEYALTNLHVYQPTSPSELLEIISSLPGYLTSSQDHSSHDQALSLLLIDGISAFYWLERSTPSNPATLNQAFSDDLPTEPPKPQLSLQSRYEKVTSDLITISTRFGANIVITNIHIPTANHSNNHNGGGGGVNPAPPSYPRHLPACYTYSPRFLSARIILSLDIVAPFHADIELKNAWKERGMRMEVVGKAGVSAWVEGAGVRKGESRRDKAEGGWFWFRIGEEGVRFGAEDEEGV